MKIVLQQLEETPDELIPGEFVGEISLGAPGEVNFSISDQVLEGRLRQLFSMPIEARSGDLSGRLHITTSRKVEPGTEDYFRQVLSILEGPEYRILGHIE
jgi:hypothetical protein